MRSVPATPVAPGLGSVLIWFAMALTKWFVAVEAKHEAILPKSTVNVSLHTLPSHRRRIASPATAVKPFPPFPTKNPVKMSTYFEDTLSTHFFVLRHYHLI